MTLTSLTLSLSLTLAACAARSPHVTLPRDARVLARGSLVYAVAFAPDDRLVSIELEERFALLVRSPDGRVLGRHDLGPAERDLVALATDGDIAFVGGRDRRVRGLALDGGGAIATWPTGADVTALAATGGHLLVGDAEGGVCLRRLADGALLQCAQLADHAIDELLVVGDRVAARAGGARFGLTVPSLALVAPPADPRGVARRGRDVWIDGVQRLHLGGAVKSVAVDGRGRIAVGAWIARLDDPSLVIVGH